MIECPFCGECDCGIVCVMGEADSFIECKNCRAAGPIADTEGKSEILWNARALRSAKEIRGYRDNIDAILQKCSCRNLEDCRDCDRNTAIAHALSWVLNESSDGVIEEHAEKARELANQVYPIDLWWGAR